MASLVKFSGNDFRYGMVDDQFGYRTDTSLFASSASYIKNCSLKKAGGLKLRPGLKSLGTSTGAKRIFAFIISTEDRFLIVLRDYRLDIYMVDTDDNSLFLLSGNAGFTTNLSESVLDEVQVAQDYERFIIVHKTCPPLVVEYREAETDGALPSFSVHDIVLDQTTDRYETDEETEEEIPYLYDYDGLFTENNFPSCVAFCANRLWFASSKEHPFRLWASKPFSYNNFQEFEYYDQIDETVTTEEYLKAIQDYTDITTDNGDGTYTKTTKTVSTDGYVVINTGTYDSDTDELIGELSTEAFNYTEPVITWEEITTEESAMVLDLSSDRNEKICWIAYALESFVIGTTSSEWIIPYDANATNVSTGKISSYGSKFGSPVAYGARNVFHVQSGGKKIRSLLTTSDGTAFLDITYYCTSATEVGIKEIAWQRVPDQVLYSVLKDGTVATLFYDNDYGVNAWIAWEFEGREIISCCVIDGETNGQDVFFLTSESEIVMLTDELYYDVSEDTPIAAEIRTQPLDSTSTLNLHKKLYNVYVASAGTQFSVNQEGVGAVSLTERDYQQKYVNVHVNNHPTTQDMRIVIQNKPNLPFEIEVIIAEVEVGE